MWLVFASAGALAGWLLMMVAVWSVLDGDGGLAGRPDGANHQ